MLVRAIENRMRGTKWEIYKNGENDYCVKFFELYAGQWRFVFEDWYTKEAVEFEFDIKLA